MTELKPCQGCEEEHKCREIYQQLGKVQGPSVVLKAVVAFLLPLLIFIGSLATFEGVLTRITGTKELRIAISFFLALFVTAATMLIIKVIIKYFHKNK